MSIRKYDGNHSARDFNRGLQTKNLVKGAAGGARGVDYQDHDAEYLERRDSSAAQNAKSAAATAKTHQAVQQAQVKEVLKQQEIAATGVPGGTPDSADDQFDPRMILNHNAVTKETPEQQRQKLEAEKLKKKLLDPNAPDDDDESDEEGAPDDEAAADDTPEEGPTVFADAHTDRVMKKASADIVARLLDDPEVELKLYGTLAMRSAEDIKEAFRTPLRVARHLNVLARRLTDGREGRPAAVRAIADTILELGPVFGRRVLSSFQAGVGIGEVYPLEVLEDIVLRSPRFVPHVKLAPFLQTPPRVQGTEGEPLEVRCDPALKITAFALKGGGYPGYAFEPAPEPGCFSLLVDTAGRYQLLLLGVDAQKNEALQELRVHVKPAGKTPLARG